MASLEEEQLKKSMDETKEALKMEKAVTSALVS